jgi:hypothetical protein
LTPTAPSQLADELISAGFQILEAITVPEVLFLGEQHPIRAVIAQGAADADLMEIRQRHITLCLNANATAGDVICELTNLFPDASATVQ